MNASRGAGVGAKRAGRRRSRFYFAMALLMIAIAVAGFWPRYYGPLLTGSRLEIRADHPLIHLHSVLFMGWLLMLLGQSLLVRSGRSALHRKVGPMLAAYGFVCAAIGAYAGLVLAARRVELGQTVDQAAPFTFVVLSDMLTFAGFLAAAVIWRRSPQTHMRLMLLATWSLAIVGFNRLLFGNLPLLAEHRWLTTFLMPLPAFIGIAYDWSKGRRAHRIWWIGLVVFVLWANRRFFAQSEAWMPTGRALVGFFA